MKAELTCTLPGVWAKLLLQLCMYLLWYFSVASGIDIEAEQDTGLAK